MRRSVVKIWRSIGNPQFQWEAMYNVNFQDLCIKTSWIHTSYEIAKVCSFSLSHINQSLSFHNDYEEKQQENRFFHFSILNSFFQLQIFCILNVIMHLLLIQNKVLQHLGDRAEIREELSKVVSISSSLHAQGFWTIICQG